MHRSFSASLQIFTFLYDTFIKDGYKGTLLAVTAYDRNNGLFPLAFSVYNIEDEGNWDWFLRGWGNRVTCRSGI